MSQDDVLKGVLDGVQEGTDGNARVSVGDVVASLDDRGFGALCTVIGILASLPVVGGVPGVSVLCAALILLIAGQHVAGRDSLWIPKFLSRRSIEHETLDTSLEKMRPYVRRLDGLIKPRLDAVVGGRTERRLIALAMCVLALTMLPLALIPWGVFPPALAITAFGIGLTARDGLFALAGYALTALTVYVLYAFSDALAGML